MHLTEHLWLAWIEWAHRLALEVTRWMNEHALISWVAHYEPWVIEHALLAGIPLALNVDGRADVFPASLSERWQGCPGVLDASISRNSSGVGLGAPN